MVRSDADYALINCTIYTGKEVLKGHAVLIKDDKIEKVCTETSLDPSIKQVDLQGQNLAPGFIDLQLNGAGGVMFNDEITWQTIETMHQVNLKTGCTSFLPTLISSADEDILEAFTAQREYQQKFKN